MNIIEVAGRDWQVSPEHNLLLVRETIGLIPEFLPAGDDRPAEEQFNERYAHGGGYLPMKGWDFSADGKLTYPGDSALSPLAFTFLEGSNEWVYIYHYAWVVIAQENSSFKVARLD